MCVCVCVCVRACVRAYVRTYVCMYVCMYAVADPGFGGRGGVNCDRQGRSGGRVREGGVPPPHLEENGNQEMLRGLLKHTKIRIL